MEVENLSCDMASKTRQLHGIKTRTPNPMLLVRPCASSSVDVSNGKRNTRLLKH